MNRESLGMVEVRGLVMAIEIADAMVKAANVRLGELTKTKGNGWMVVKVFGDVGAVNAAVDCGKHLAAQKNSLISSKVIPRPIDNIFFVPDKSVEPAKTTKQAPAEPSDPVAEEESTKQKPAASQAQKASENKSSTPRKPRRKETPSKPKEEEQ